MARRTRTPIIGVDRGIGYSSGVARQIMGSLVLVGAILLVLSAAIVFAIGRPPRTFTIVAGVQGGAYVAFAEALRDDLAKRGFSVNIVETAGSVDNVGLLRSGAADVGIVQSGTDSFLDIGGLTAISELFYEPVWIATVAPVRGRSRGGSAAGTAGSRWRSTPVIRWGAT